MSDSRLAKLKAAFLAEKDKKNNNKGTKRRGDFYPFWEMKTDEKAVVRILPDKNDDNPFIFYVEKLEHKLAIDGKDERIPCLTMYGEKCPICALSADYYKREGKGSPQGKYYWRTKNHLVRVLVIDDPLPADEDTKLNAVGSVLTAQLSWQLMGLIKAALCSDDMEGLEPWDLKDGFNFTIQKSALGDNATYTLGSAFARKSTSIADAGCELIDLQTLLPANPGLDAVERKLNLHLGNVLSDSHDGDGDGHDDDADGADDASVHDIPAPKPTPVEDKKEEAQAPASAPAGESSGAELLANIRRQRQLKAAAAESGK